MHFADNWKRNRDTRHAISAPNVRFTIMYLTLLAGAPMTAVTQYYKLYPSRVNVFVPEQPSIKGINESGDIEGIMH